MTSEPTNAIGLETVSGLDLAVDPEALELQFGAGVIHPAGERRTLDDVRATLADPDADGPEQLYTIYMDIADEPDLPRLLQQQLLYGAVVYNHGAIGNERLRSQGHIHSAQPGTGLRYSEVYEFWTGHGHVYLQKECASEVTRALLVPVGPGDKVIVPLGWVHLTVASDSETLAFGAWCARENELEYGGLRELGGPAHFVLADGEIVANPRYARVPEVEIIQPGDLPLLG
ncbi:MAG: glucose-6-phosphate isomerase family protein, partial [Chloroflexota bacterium]